MLADDLDVFLWVLVSMETLIHTSVRAWELHVVSDARCAVGKSARSGYAKARPQRIFSWNCDNSCRYGPLCVW
jgi:hypothetical protein